MSVGTGIIAGLIIGWIIEWLIDWRFWRTASDTVSGGPVSDEEMLAKTQQLQDQLDASQEEVARLKDELARSAEIYSNNNEELATQTGKDK